MPLCPSNAFVKTRTGLITLRALSGSADLWSGNDWVPVALEKVDEAKFSQVTLENGFEFYAHPHTQVLACGTEQYYWKTIESLKKKDVLCAGLPEGSHNFTAHYRSIDYWIGYMFMIGLKDRYGISFPIDREKIRDACTAFSDCFQTMVHIDYIDNDPIAQIRGDLYKKVLDKLGLWFNDEGMLETIPIWSFVRGVRLRRAFCRGAVEAIEYPYRLVSWPLKMKTKARALDLQRMLRSCGVGSYRVVEDDELHIARWASSVELNTRTHYPSEEEIRHGMITTEVLGELLTRINRNRKVHHSSSKKFCDNFYSLYTSAPAKTFHPAAARAAWLSMGVKNKIPIYDGATVDNVIPSVLDAPAINITAESLEIDGYIIKG